MDATGGPPDACYLCIYCLVPFPSIYLNIQSSLPAGAQPVMWINPNQRRDDKMMVKRTHMFRGDYIIFQKYEGVR